MAGVRSTMLKILIAIDVFSYVPVPQAYPVSTKKSRIGSVLFICGILGYLIYDFYQFVTNSVPTINAYTLGTTNIKPLPQPQIAFGLEYHDTKYGTY